MLVKIGFPCHTLTLRSARVHMSGTTPYVRYVGARGEPHFLSTVHLFSDS
jgi:hypothetical protein